MQPFLETKTRCGGSVVCPAEDGDERTGASTMPQTSGTMPNGIEREQEAAAAQPRSPLQEERIKLLGDSIRYDGACTGVHNESFVCMSSWRWG